MLLLLLLLPRVVVVVVAIAVVVVAVTCCCCCYSTFLEFNIFLCKFLEFEPLEHKFPTNLGNRFRWS